MVVVANRYVKKLLQTAGAHLKPPGASHSGPVAEPGGRHEEVTLPQEGVAGECLRNNTPTCHSVEVGKGEGQWSSMTP